MDSYLLFKTYGELWYFNIYDIISWVIVIVIASV